MKLDESIVGATVKLRDGTVSLVDRFSATNSFPVGSTGSDLTWTLNGNYSGNRMTKHIWDIVEVLDTEDEQE